MMYPFIPTWSPFTVALASTYCTKILSNSGEITAYLSFDITLFFASAWLADAIVEIMLVVASVPTVTVDAAFNASPNTSASTWLDKYSPVFLPYSKAAE